MNNIINYDREIIYFTHSINIFKYLNNEYKARCKSLCLISSFEVVLYINSIDIAEIEKLIRFDIHKLHTFNLYQLCIDKKQEEKGNKVSNITLYSFNNNKNKKIFIIHNYFFIAFIITVAIVLQMLYMMLQCIKHNRLIRIRGDTVKYLSYN